MQDIIDKINSEYSRVEAFTTALFRYLKKAPSAKTELKKPKPDKAKITLPATDPHSR